MAENIVKESKIILTNRKELNITGVLKVNSVNETFASLTVSDGVLLISGKDIKMKKLLVDEGVALMEGEFNAFKFGNAKSEGNFLKRIFK